VKRFTLLIIAVMVIFATVSILREPTEAQTALAQSQAPSCSFDARTITVSADKAAIADGRSGPGEQESFGDCYVSTEVRANPDAKITDASASCQFILVVAPGPYFEAESRHVGNCDGVGLFTSVNLPPAGGTVGKSAPNVTSDVSAWWDIRIIGNDVIHLPIYLAYQQMQIGYDFDCINWANTQHWQWGDDWWGISFQTYGEWYSHPVWPCWEYYAYNYVHFHSDGFPNSASPDADAWVQPALRAVGNGWVGCEFWDASGGYWEGYNLHNHYYCNPI
jgi:hypothetical protein